MAGAASGHNQRAVVVEAEVIGEQLQKQMLSGNSS